MITVFVAIGSKADEALLTAMADVSCLTMCQRMPARSKQASRVLGAGIDDKP